MASKLVFRPATIILIAGVLIGGNCAASLYSKALAVTQCSATSIYPLNYGPTMSNYGLAATMIVVM